MTPLMFQKKRDAHSQSVVEKDVSRDFCPNKHSILVVFDSVG